MRDRSPRWQPPWAVFLALSAVAHVGTFAATHRGAPPPAPVAFEPPEQAVTLAGDTFDVPPTPADREAPAETLDAPSPSPAPPLPGPPPPTPTPSPSRAHALAPTHALASPAPSPPPLFGAVGARLATDLATSFTRAFPQVASADPAWAAAALGSTSAALLTLVLDDDGHLEGGTITGAPAEALRRGIERALVLLKAREFTARSSTTRLRITAHVARDDVHDGLHGDVFALSGGSFAGDVGTAFFALPPSAGPGRRIDVEIRMLP